MDIVLTLFTMAGGLGFFLFGMNLMGTNLKKAAGAKLEGVLERVSSTPLKGAALGTVTTAAMQSSSATTVMVVGFVNSGLMTLTQAMGVVAGANLGTTVTAWLLSLAGIGGGSSLLSLLKPSSFAPLVVFAGALFYVFSSRGRRKDLAAILLGFGTLLVGMTTMSDATRPFAESQAFLDVLTVFSNPFLGVLIGAALTAVIQSSSATIGILQALSLTGAVPFGTAIPLIIGMDIGACVPVLLSGIGATADGRRTTVFYLYFNLFTGAAFMIPFYIINIFRPFAFLSAAASPVGIAAFNTLLKAAALVIVLLLLPLFRRLLTLTVREKEADRRTDVAALLDERFLNLPEIALEQCRKGVNIMRELTRDSIVRAIALRTAYSADGARAIEEAEDKVDECEDKLGSYLVRLSSFNLSEKESREAGALLHTIGDFERISDHALNLSEAAREIREKKVTFSPDAEKELVTVSQAILEILNVTCDAFAYNDTVMAAEVEPLEQVIDLICDTLKNRHVERLQRGVCGINQGFVFNDIISNYSRISDHCSNIAVTLIRSGAGSFDPHEYLGRIKKENAGDFRASFENYKKIYYDTI